MRLKFIRDWKKDDFATYKIGTVKEVFVTDARLLIMEGFAIPTDEEDEEFNQLIEEEE